MKKVIIMTLLICAAGYAAAQGEQVFKPIVLQLEQAGGNHTYALEAFSYSISHSQKDSVTGAYIPVLQLSFSLQMTPDAVLLDWLTVPGTEKNGKFQFRDVKSGTVTRTFTFAGAQIQGWNESVSDYSFRDGSASTIYMDIKCREFAIENHPLKNFKSYYDD